MLIMPLIVTIFLFSISSATAGGVKNWEVTLNEFLTLTVDFACVEKRSPELKACSIPTDKCKRFATLVAKNCLGQIIASGNPVKHPKDMTQEELLSVIDKAAVCTGRTMPVITYCVCPEQHENSWAGNGGYKYQGKRNR